MKSHWHVGLPYPFEVKDSEVVLDAISTVLRSFVLFVLASYHKF